jgi:hypothetical protein
MTMADLIEKHWTELAEAVEAVWHCVLLSPTVLIVLWCVRAFLRVSEEGKAGDPKSD